VKFEIVRNEFLDGLTRAAACAAKAISLNNALIEVRENEIVIQTIGAESGFSGVYDAITHGTNSVIINAKNMSEFVKSLSSETVVVTDEAPNGSILPNALIVKTKGSVGRLKAIFNVQDWQFVPNIETSAFVKMPVADLTALVQSTHYCTETDGSHYLKQGIFFKFADNGASVTSMGQSTSSISTTTRKFDPPLGIEGRIVVPNKCVNELQRLLTSAHDDGEFLIHLKSNMLVVRYENMTYYLRLLDGLEYTDLSDKLPGHMNTNPTFVASRDAFLESLDRITRVFSPTKFNVTKIRVSSKPEEEQPNGLMELDCADTNVGDLNEEIRGAFTGESAFVGMNATTLRSVITNEPFVGDTGKNVIIEFGQTSTHHVMIFSEKDPNFKALIMPMRLREPSAAKEPPSMEEE